MEKRIIRLGYAPTKRDVFNHPEANEYRESVLEKIMELSNDSAVIIDIKGINDDDMIQTNADVQKVVKRFQKEKIDGIFVPHCNFGMESVVARVAVEINKPLLLWGPRDNTPVAGEFRTRDTQCGLFATGKALRRVNVPFTYLPNCDLDDDAFTKGFMDFLAVCSVVDDFRNTRVLQIGTRPEPFWTVICNEGELLERFGIQVMPLTLEDLKTRIELLEKNKSEEVEVALRDFKARLNCGCANDTQLRTMARLRVALKQLCIELECNSIALFCWDALHKATGSATCTVNGILTEEGIPVSCETDILGAISSIMIQAAVMRTKSTFFADLTIRHPTNPNAEMLWHCGNYPPSLAIDPNTCNLTMINPDSNPIPAQSNWEIKHGDITVCRFDGDHGDYRLFIGEGKGVDGPETSGTYVWFEVDDWLKWEKHLVEGPYVHHCSGVHAKVAHILAESCKYLGIIPDAISPNSQDIEERWLTGKTD